LEWGLSTLFVRSAETSIFLMSSSVTELDELEEVPNNFLSILHKFLNIHEEVCLRRNMK